MFSFNTVNYFNKYTIYFSYPKSWVMWAIIDLHDYLMFFIINIFLVVVIYMFLILVIQQNFFQKADIIGVYTFLKVKDYNDEPLLEFFWTIFPALLLTVMSWPSFTLLYAMEQLIDPFHTVIITGNQWYWTYQYSDFDVVSDIIIQLDSLKGFDYFSKIIKKELNLSVVYDEIKYTLPYFNYADFLEKSSYSLNLINPSSVAVSDFFKDSCFTYADFLEKSSYYLNLINPSSVAVSDFFKEPACNFIFTDFKIDPSYFSNYKPYHDDLIIDFLLKARLCEALIKYYDCARSKLTCDLVLNSYCDYSNIFTKFTYKMDFTNYDDFINSSLFYEDTLIDTSILDNLMWEEFKSLFKFSLLIKAVLSSYNIDSNTFGFDEFRKFFNEFVQAEEAFCNMLMAPNEFVFEDFKRDFKNSLIIKYNFNYWDLIQFIGKHARKYESTQLIYDAMIISDDNLPIGYPRLLCTDQVLILPANVSIRLLITSSDVIHSWALPSHGIKMDAIPGRVNQVPFLTPFWGTYWGQCSELCGINHGFMPIEVRVVCLEDYLSFIKLNISYKYDKFCPLIRNLIASYVSNLGEENIKKEINK